MRVRRTTSSRQHPTCVKETTTGTASAPPEERDSDAQGGDCRARQRPRAASVRPSILCTPSAASNAPAPDAQPDLRESCPCVPSLSRAIALTSRAAHTTRVGTPSVPLFPVSLYSHAYTSRYLSTDDLASFMSLTARFARRPPCNDCPSAPPSTRRRRRCVRAATRTRIVRGVGRRRSVTQRPRRRATSDTQRNGPGSAKDDLSHICFARALRALNSFGKLCVCTACPGTQK